VVLFANALTAFALVAVDHWLIRRLSAIGGYSAVDRHACQGYLLTTEPLLFAADFGLMHINQPLHAETRARAVGFFFSCVFMTSV